VYRVLFIIVIILAVALGLLVGTLNSERVAVDLLWLELEWPLGLVLLCAAAAGLLLGLLLIWLFSVLPLRAQLRRTRSRNSKSDSRLTQLDD
jgi:uncharacterized integral membrane protein